VAGRVGVLALQGAFREHGRALADVGLDAVEVRRADQLDELDGLVIPGGESTTMWKLMDAYGLEQPIRALHDRGAPVFGTCAGMIVVARETVDGVPGQRSLGLIDVVVRRNAFGRQVASFEGTCEVEGAGRIPTVFIRAPRITAVGRDVEVLATVDVGDGAHPVLVRQGPVLGASFHPELTDDRTVHRLFLELAADEAAVGAN